MTERRYFYTDPLAAAWMAKRFGMRFQNLNNGVEIALEDILRHAATGNACRINIHPYSLNLLKVVNGDTVATNGGDWGGEKRVTRRDGQPFHWPESE